MTNLVAWKDGQNVTGDSPVLILGAHFDARIRADKDPDFANRLLPVPGINDGGSGVAILLELARTLQVPANYTVGLVFFDAEDQGGIPGWAGGIGGWCIGSTYFVEALNTSIKERVRFAIIVDLVGSPNLRLTKEGSSNKEIMSQIWDVAGALGFNSTFIDAQDIAIIDDHKPFLDAGIRAVDIIQIQDEDGFPFFKWHHTRNDTLDNISPESLFRVGRTLEKYIESFGNVSDSE
ncbi:MAG: M28 family peptidase, partial [Candidatus Ranarchaeia archaeon]